MNYYRVGLLCSCLFLLMILLLYIQVLGCPAIPHPAGPPSTTVLELPSCRLSSIPPLLEPTRWSIIKSLVKLLESLEAPYIILGGSLLLMYRECSTGRSRIINKSAKTVNN